MTNDELKRIAYILGRGGKSQLFAAWAATHTIEVSPPKVEPSTVLIFDSFKEDCPAIDIAPHRRWIPPTVRLRGRR